MTNRKSFLQNVYFLNNYRCFLFQMVLYRCYPKEFRKLGFKKLSKQTEVQTNSIVQDDKSQMIELNIPQASSHMELPFINATTL